jgi:uncharacterized Fe-S cluster-containing protein
MSSESKEIKSEEGSAKDKPRKCIICDKPAEYCVKGLPNTCYCRECALKQFKQLNYLEKF